MGIFGSQLIGFVGQVGRNIGKPDLRTEETEAEEEAVLGPVFVSAEIGEAGDSTMIIIFSDTFNETITPATSAFTLGGITGDPTIEVVTVFGFTIVLSLSGDAVAGDTITVAYTKPAINQLQDTDGNVVQTFEAQSVTNNV